MCDRYSFALSKDKIARRFEIKASRAPEANYNISPGSIVPVITAQPAQRLDFYRWGLERPINSKKKDTHLLHAIQADSIVKQPGIYQLLETQRCLIPADGFYLWQQISRKSRVPYRVVLKWNLPFAFAGIYDVIPAADGPEPPGYACCLFTTKSNELLGKIQAFMPVILPLDAEKEWLSNLSVQEAISMLKTYAADKMNYFPVTTRINDPAFNSIDLLQAVQATDQFGNYILFES